MWAIAWTAIHRHAAATDGSLRECEPVYEAMPGWTDRLPRGLRLTTICPEAAQAYLTRIEEILETPVDIVSTGPGREAVIIRRHPFDDN